MSLLHLPVELLEHVAQDLSTPDVNALAQTCRHLFFRLDRLLYRRDAGQPHSSALRWAAQQNLDITGRKAIGAGADVNSGRHLDRHPSPLLVATNHANDKVVRLLLDVEGINVNAKGPLASTPLCMAAQEGNYAIASSLVSHRSTDVDAADDLGRTPLCHAVTGGHARIVKLLLDTGRIDVNAKVAGRTVLSHAATSRSPASGKIVRMLLDAGADPGLAVDSRGRGPLSHAAELGKLDVVKMLLGSPKVHADELDDMNLTPIRWATMGLHRDIVQLLLQSLEPDEA